MQGAEGGKRLAGTGFRQRKTGNRQWTSC